MEETTTDGAAEAARAPGEISRAAGLLIAIAGALALAGGLLGWARLTYPVPGPRIESISVGHANVAVFLGAFLLVVGIAAVLVPRPAIAPWIAVSAVAGIVVAGFAVFDLATARDRAVSSLVALTARAEHLSIAEVHALVAKGIVRFGYRAGIFLAIAAGALCLAAALALVVAARRRTHPAAGDPAP